MGYVITRTARLGFVTVVVATLTAGICGDAVAKFHKGHLHDQRSISESRAELMQPVRLGAMRYYGGPKSPMWRGPAEN
jgi:hypothetical protein